MKRNFRLMQAPPQHHNQPVDKVFFRKEQITIGTTLICYGRRDPYSEWIVEKLFTYVQSPRTLEWRLQPANEVTKLSDLVVMRRRDADDNQPSTRRMTFSAMSYSAIWRVK